MTALSVHWSEGSLVQRVTGPNGHWSESYKSNSCCSSYSVKSKSKVSSNDQGRLRLLLPVNPNIFKRIGLLLVFPYTLPKLIHLRTQLPSLSGHHKIFIAPPFRIMPRLFTHAMQSSFIWSICVLQLCIMLLTDSATWNITQWTIKKRGSLFLTITLANLNWFL